MESTKLRISSIIPISEANGPGKHYCIWVQGCSLKCQGCFNPHTHDPSGGYLKSVQSIVKEINYLWKRRSIRGVTLTGGEPLQQMEAVHLLLSEIKKVGNIGTILLTGYSKGELGRLPNFDKLKEFLDVIIAGRYIERLKVQESIRGSSNKQLMLYSSFYKREEFRTIPPLEIITQLDGSIVVTGIQPDSIQDIND